MTTTETEPMVYHEFIDRGSRIYRKLEKTLLSNELDDIDPDVAEYDFDMAILICDFQSALEKRYLRPDHNLTQDRLNWLFKSAKVGGYSFHTIEKNYIQLVLTGG